MESGLYVMKRISMIHDKVLFDWDVITIGDNGQSTPSVTKLNGTWRIRS